MKSTHTKFLLMGAFLASIIFIGVGAAPPAPIAPKFKWPNPFLPAGAKQSGADRYLPTKAEWLALYMTVRNGNDFGATAAEKFDISYRIGKTHNSVAIRCIYMDTVDRRAMNQVLAIARQALEREIKSRDWGWVKIEEELHLVK